MKWKVYIVICTMWKGCLPPKVIFPQWLSSTEGHFPPKVVFYRRSYSTEGCCSPVVVLLSSTNVRLTPTIPPWLILYLWEQSTFQISSSYLAYKWLEFFWTNEVNKTNKRKKSYIEAACCLKRQWMGKTNFIVSHTYMKGRCSFQKIQKLYSMKVI